MKHFIKKYEWYFWGLLQVNIILIAFLFFVLIFNLFPCLYINLLHCFARRPLTGNEVIVPFIEYLKIYAIQVGFSFVLAFPCGLIIKYM